MEAAEAMKLPMKAMYTFCSHLARGAYNADSMEKMMACSFLVPVLSEADKKVK